ncbi:hypothetical protein DUI87_03883 [Hirundo rustica rustica]|uniref:Uncharacterized protein n=1 Tax=Hirundo rustica rustica TaxID=333673 RepID=A0A3M0L2F8_HIRRU|nr:hypothetical protein DUI87_03883 [Hirundo rustica rustica]
MASVSCIIMPAPTAIVAIGNCVCLKLFICYILREVKPGSSAYTDSWLKTVLSYSVSGCLGEEINPYVATATLQEVVESDKVTSESPFLQAKQPQLPQSFLTGLEFQVLQQPRCPPLEALKHLNVLPKLRGPELDAALKFMKHMKKHVHFLNVCWFLISVFYCDVIELGSYGNLKYYDTMTEEGKFKERASILHKIAKKKCQVEDSERQNGAANHGP